MTSSSRIALSGLNAAQADLAVTSNNIANAATTGFKSSRTEFAEIFAASPASSSNTEGGGGVRVANIAQQFSQGSIEYTENNLDLAMSGDGFFIVKDGGATAYTRAGAFAVDRDGFVVNAFGNRLQVYQPIATGGFNTGALTDLQLATTESPPSATANIAIAANLPATAAVPATAVFDPLDPTSYNNATSLTVYDSLGAAHTGTLYFVKGAVANEWSTRLYVDGTAVGGAQALTYSPTGAPLTPATGNLAFPAYTPATGAAPITVTLNVSKTTQYGSAFSVNTLTQDGYTTGRLVGMEIDSTGVATARFTNGRSIALGKVALANFPNMQGLVSAGDTNWTESFESGQARLGEAGNSGFGVVRSGALEASNVDITEQLVNMITAQRNFQANAQMISTTDQLTQSIINLR